jgi:hypothetical protein
MIVNEIAKFENPLHARWEVLLVAQLGEPRLIACRRSSRVLIRGLPSSEKV